jgi:MoaA/NifB/PqqE/SkfB family radical SAM enzyme
MVRVARGLGFEIGLVTNGIELDEYFDVLNSFVFVRISLDAASDNVYRKIKGTSHFAKVVKNIRKAIEIRSDGTTIGLSYVVCGDNESEVGKARRLAYRLGVDYIQIKPAHGLRLKGIRGNHKTIVTERHLANSELPCAIAGLVGIVGADACVYYCCQKRGIERYKMGSLLVDDFSNIWLGRPGIEPRVEGCYTCRYMNYAEGYRKFSRPKYRYLRHKYFL